MLSAGSARAEVPAPQFGYSGACVFLTDSGPAASGPPLCLSSPIVDLVQAGDVLYAARDRDGVSFIDVTTPARPREALRFARGHDVRHLARREDQLLLDLADKTVLVYDIHDRRLPRYAHSYGPDDPQRPDVPQASAPVPAVSFAPPPAITPAPPASPPPQTGAPLLRPPALPLRKVWRRQWPIAAMGGIAFGAVYLANVIAYAATDHSDGCLPLWPLTVPLAGPWITLFHGCQGVHEGDGIGPALGYVLVGPPLILDGLLQAAAVVTTVLGVSVRYPVWVPRHALQLAPLRVPGGSGLAVSLQF